MSRDVGGSKNFNYDDTIKKLLEEGRRLGTVETDCDVKIDRKPIGTRQFSNDVSKLRQEIDDQNKKTLELQNEIKQTTVKFRTSSSRPKPAFLSNMNTNNNSNNYPPVLGPYGDVTSVPLPPRQYQGTSTSEYLERALEDSQTQVKYLTRKLEESQETTEKQKVHFRTAVEELQNKLQETIAGRKHLVQLRETEMEEQEEMIQKLQTTLKELAAANQMQEQSLLDANDRMQLLEKRNQSNDKAIDRIKMLFSSHQKIKGRTYRVADNDHLSEISPEFLAENVEHAMNEMYEEIEAMRNSIMQLENELCDINQDHGREIDMLTSKQMDVAEQLKIEMNERVLEEKLNTDSAMKQVYSLQDELQQQKYVISSKDQEIRDIEKELTVITDQFEELKSHYFDDKESLQSKLLDTENELSSTKQTNETYKSECERLKKQLSDSQENFLRTNEDLKSEREQRRNLWIKENELSKEITEIRQQLEEKSSEIASLKDKNSELQVELSTQVVEKVREAEVVERSKADRKISELNEDMTRLRDELSRTKATLESTERQISDVMVERSDTLKIIQDKDLQLERISSQCNTAERRLSETTEARKHIEEKWEKLYKEYNEISQKWRKNQTENEKMKNLLDEKEKLVMTLQLRVENMTTEALKVAKEIEEVKVERSRLNVEVKEKSRDLDQIRNQLTVNEKSVSDYENRIGELIQEKNKVDSKARITEDENRELKRDLEQLDKDLGEARLQITTLLEEKDEIKRQKIDFESKSKSVSDKLKKQLRHMKRNLQDAEASLKTIKSVDGRAAKIAENMQKEVTDKRSVIDTLQSELSKTLDKLTELERGNKNLKSEVEISTEKYDEMENTRQKLETDLKQSKKTEKGYKLAVERLEKGLEKAAIRNSAAQATIAQQEKDIAQLHIQHNLQMMNKRPGTQIQAPDQPSTINTLYQPTIAQPGTNVAQSMLARLIMNMKSQPAMNDVTNQMGNPTKVPSAENVPRNSENPPGNDTVTSDMYKVLSEVKEHLAKLEKSPVKKRSPVKKKTRKSKDLEERLIEFDSESSELPVVTMASEMSSMGSLSLLQSATMGSTMKDSLTTSPYKPDETHTSGGAIERHPSPVSELLRPPDTRLKRELFSLQRKSPKKVLHDNTDSNSGTSDNSSDIPVSNTAALKNAITNTAEDLCRQLQDRLEGLSKMGGKLKQQNKMTERMIQKQDEKIQKVRGGMKFR
ncbi:coiled-coil domain-containing protein 158-like isoform X2 [Styela clava]